MSFGISAGYTGDSDYLVCTQTGTSDPEHPGLPENLETTTLAATSFHVPRLLRWLLLEVRVDWLVPEAVIAEAFALAKRLGLEELLG